MIIDKNKKMISEDHYIQCRVYLEDTDAQGVVYNANYLRFFERARTEWLRKALIDHNDLKIRYNILLVLSKIEVNFITPACLDDLLLVTAKIHSISGAKFIFDQSIYKSSVLEKSGDLLYKKLLVSGIAEVACIDTIRSKPVRIPKDLVNKLKDRDIK